MFSFYGFGWIGETAAAFSICIFLNKIKIQKTLQKTLQKIWNGGIKFLKNYLCNRKWNRGVVECFLTLCSFWLQLLSVAHGWSKCCAEWIEAHTATTKWPFLRKTKRCHKLSLLKIIQFLKKKKNLSCILRIFWL
jgi:hypothetical protein